MQINEVHQSFGFNGELTIESKKDFIVQNVVLAALQGLHINAERIRNRGVIKTQGSLELNVLHEINNDRGELLCDSNIQLNGRHLSNRSGKIVTPAGQIIWKSGYQVTLSNDYGTIFGQFGVLRLNKHRKAPPPNTVPSQLKNNHGKIIAPEGPIEIFLDKNENFEG